MTGLKSLSIVIVFAVATAALAAGQLKTPSEWKWRIDGGQGKVVDSEELRDGETRFVEMAPGWHVTTKPATLLYHPDYSGKGTFTVETDIFLFPGESQDEYGIFLGGTGLGTGETAGYVAFVARRDGRGAVLRSGGTPIVDWKPNDGLLPHPGKDTVKNTIRVDVTPTDVVFAGNGKEIARVPRSALNVEGQIGFRFGRNLNVHASRLDVTYKLAPVPIKK